MELIEEITCVHCGKAFRAEVLAPGSELAGVKCPHCRLFMPLERVDAVDEDSVATR